MSGRFARKSAFSGASQIISEKSPYSSDNEMVLSPAATTWRVGTTVESR
jgi:hypothetical protein